MKKNLKKGLSLILTVAMMFTFVTGIQAFAAGTMNVTSSVASTVEVGDTIVQTISLADLTNVVGGVRAFIIKVAFDSTKLSATVSNVAVTEESGIVYGTFVEAGTGELSVTNPVINLVPNPNKIDIVYMDKGDGLGGRSPITTVDPTLPILTITYTALVAGTTDITLSTGAAENFIGFIDCSNPASNATTLEVAARTIVTTFDVPIKTVIITEPVADVLEPIAPLVIDATGNYVYGIAPGKTVEQVKAMFVNSTNVEIAGATDNMVGTGCVISQKVGDDSLTVVIVGDLDGNASIDVLDLVKTNAVILGSQTVVGVFALATDVDGSKLIDVLDLVKMNAVILGSQTITQVLPIV